MWLRFVAFPLAVLAGLLVAGLLAVGLVVVLAYPQLPSLDALLSAADRALYEAKATGRGQVRLAEPAELAAVKAA